ncbi:MAG: hypothetical protein GY712_00275 [Oceanicoccus sp.]|uniref:hypothetical protein n=1 Tax=Oceanicoccus sp. TaxID=2691044 RepID=UPI002611247B|nr:hypothetical protein [Oceanicoccus sp.]MCP3906443.1 hypothetical protein [Oceanicoccus sp.]
MRLIILLSVILLAACTPAKLQVKSGDIAVVIDIQAFEKTDQYQDCPDNTDTKTGEECISMNCGYAEYTYNALSIQNYVAGDADWPNDETKKLTILAPLPHRCFLNYLSSKHVVRLGAIWDQLSIEHSARVFDSKKGPVIFDPIFINANGWADYYRKAPYPYDKYPICYSPFQESDNYDFFDGDALYLAAMNTPGAYENEDEEVCLSMAVFLEDVQDLPSNKALQQDQPTAGR